MLYLDYSATTPVDKRVLNDFVEASNKYIGNPNSQHSLGKLALEAIKTATLSIQHTLKLSQCEVIYTSGATESNNLAIKGIASSYHKQGKHIIASPYEHPSSIACLNYLSENGYEIELLTTYPDGLIHLDELTQKLRKDTILVSIASVNSETGILQPIGEIAKLVKSNSSAIFHSDMTQSIGKINVELDNVDLITLAAHKFYGIRGIGALIRKTNVLLEPLIHGGRSLSLVRSGTPPTALIISLAKALEYAYQELETQIDLVYKLHDTLVEKLLLHKNVLINSTDHSIPHILNVSFIKMKADHLQKLLQEHDIFVSTQSACSLASSYSHTIFRMYQDELRAKTSIRISLSHLTTFQEIERLLEVLTKEVFYANN